MAEIYVGVKFGIVRLPAEKIDGSKVEELIGAGKELAARGFCPENSGNMSFRQPEGFVITRAGSELGSLTAGDFVLVKQVNLQGKKVFAAGKSDPSSEAMMHFLIYEARRDVSVILHAHALRLKDAVATPKAYPYGTFEFAQSAVEVLKDHDLVILKDHGFVSVGKTVEEAFKRIKN
jgi:L-fuculose-phosphate aldolase